MPRTSLHLSRRDWLRLSATGIAGYSMSGWLGTLSADAATDPKRRRSCILLWMNGGPSQMDTFDLKSGHVNGGPFREIATAVPGIKISEHLPRLARHMDRLVLVRSMRSKEGDHDLANYYVHAGYLKRGPIQYPTIGALVAKETGVEKADLPTFVSIAPDRSLISAAQTSGFLGPRYAPLIVGDGRYSERRAWGSRTYRRMPGSAASISRTGCTWCSRCSRNSSPTIPAQRQRAIRPPTSGPPGSCALPRGRRSISMRNRPNCATPTAAIGSARVVCWPGAWSNAAYPSSRCRWAETTASAGTPT